MSNGFGTPLLHARQYSNQLLQGDCAANKNYDNGTNWMVIPWSHLVQDGSDIVLNHSPNDAARFNSSLVVDHGRFETMSHDSTTNIYTVVHPDGTIWEFNDFVQTTDPQGSLACITTPGGQQIQFSYNMDGTCATCTRSSGSDEERLSYAYSGGLLSNVTLQRKTSGTWGSSHNIRQCAYTYHDGTTGYGATDDLETAVQKTWNGSTWDDEKTHYFRYYKSGESNGFEHGLQYYLSPEAYSRATNPTTATDAHVAQFADLYVEYDSDHRVKTVKTNGGEYTYSYAYTVSAHADSYSNWHLKTVETLPNSKTYTVYSNYIGAPLLQELKSGADVWIDYFKYDSDGRETEHAHPSAIDTYNDTSSDLSVTYKEDEDENTEVGRVDITDYASSTSGTISDTVSGNVKGYITTLKVRLGLTGTVTKLRAFEYYKKTGGGGTVYPLAKQTLYQSDASGGSDGVTTTFTYSWHSGTVQAQDVTTTFPSVSTSKNGENTTHTQVDRFNTFGQLEWNKGGRGFIRYHEYDTFTGAIKKTVEDVDDGVLTSSPWSTPSGGGLHLETDYELDASGRVTEELGPTHSVDIGGTSTSIRRASWFIYDGVDEIRVGHGYKETAGGTFTLINPVQITKMDLNGRTIESISATKGSGTTSTKLVAANTFAQSSYVRWTTSTYSDEGELTSEKVYHDIPDSGTGSSGTEYDETTYGYDSMGRQDEVTTPGGTLTRTTFDERGNVSKIEVGTTTQTPVQVAAFEYDDGGAGKDGNLTKRTDNVDSSNTRVTTYTYDFRNRLETTDGEVDFFEKLYYDNLDRVTKTERYDTTESASNLIARSEMKYDERGRVYQTVRHEVAVGSGTVGDAITDNKWFDCCGNVIKDHPGGSEQFTKYVYDGVARVTDTYVGYDVSESAYSEADDVSGDTIFEQTTVGYDDAGNLTWSTRLQRYHDASATGSLTAGTNARPEHVAMWHDALGRKIATAQYGNQGNDSTSFSRPETVPTRSDTVLVGETEFDATGEAFKMTDPAGKEDRVEFDDAGRRTKTIENYTDGNPSTGGYDEDVTVEFTYTADGSVATIKAKNRVTDDQTTTYTYGTDSNSDVYRNDLLVKEQYPDSSGGTDVVTYTYNRLGEIKTKKDQNGSTHTYEYDDLGRRSTDKISAGSGVDTAVLRIATEYEERGLVSKVTSYDKADTVGATVVNEIVREYDDMGLLTKEYQEHSGAKSGSTPSVSYAYDDTVSSGELTKGLRPETITYPSGRVITYNYSGNDANYLNRISGVQTNAFSGGGTAQSSYEYLGLGTVVEVDYEEPDVRLDLIGTGNSYSGVDRFGRIIDQKWYDYGSSSDADRYKYGYDRASNRLYRENTLTSSKDEYYTYDEAYRLEVSDRGDLNVGKTAISGTPARKITTELDPTGNWDAFVIQNSGTYELLQGRTHNKANEIDGGSDDFSTISGTDWANVTYDKNGNMTVVPQPGALGSSYDLTFDAWNRLVKVEDGATTVAVYEYDGVNRRISKDVGGTVRHFFYTDRWQVVEERVDSDTDPADHYIWGVRYIDDLILRDRDTASTPDGTFDQRHYSLQDADFNVTGIVDHNGNVQERYEYDPYGQVGFLTSSWASSSSSYDTQYLFTGRRLDDETGIYSYRNRLQHPQLGRFISRDPIGYKDGPNLYWLTSIGHVDPFGLTQCKTSVPKFTTETLTLRFRKAMSHEEVAPIVEEKMKPFKHFKYSHRLNMKDSWGMSGLVLGIRGRVVVSGCCCDYSAVTIKAFFLNLIENRGAPRQRPVVFPATGTSPAIRLPSPKDTEEHENWHLHGLPREIVDRIQYSEGYIPRPGFKYGATRLYGGLKKCLYDRANKGKAETQKSCVDKLKECYDGVIGNPTNLLNATQYGFWHIKKDDGLQSYYHINVEDKVIKPKKDDPFYSYLIKW